MKFAEARIHWDKFRRSLIKQPCTRELKYLNKTLLTKPPVHLGTLLSAGWHRITAWHSREGGGVDWHCKSRFATSPPCLHFLYLLEPSHQGWQEISVENLWYPRPQATRATELPTPPLIHTQEGSKDKGLCYDHHMDQQNHSPWNQQI